MRKRTASRPESGAGVGVGVGVEVGVAALIVFIIINEVNYYTTKPTTDCERQHCDPHTNQIVDVPLRVTFVDALCL